MKNIRTLLAALLCAAMCLCGVSFADEAEPVYYQLGDTINDFTVTTYDGREVSLYGLLEEKDMVLINIWATWCGPCRNEFPFMQEAYEIYGEDVGIIALSCEATDTPDVLEAFAAEMGLTFNISQDSVGMADSFMVSGIPTSIVIDRFGTVCFVEAGSLPDVDSFARLFEAFIGDDYTESVLLNGVPAPKPDVEPSDEADITAALNVEGGELVFTNGTSEYDWPMIVGEKDGRSVVISSNTGVATSEANVHTTVSAKAGDAIVVEFKISSEAGCDIMQLRINGEVVKSFGGEDGWMTYAYAVEADGEYEVTVAYVNDAMASAGEDTLWIDSVAVVSGEAAAAAVAANPVYPVSDEVYVKVLTEGAKQVVIDDPTGTVEMYYGDLFYLIPSDTVTFELGMIAGYDPEVALISFNYDGSTFALSDCIVDGKYVVSGGADSIETTGYCDSSVYLYPSLEDYASGVALTYMMSEENVNYLVNDLTVDENGNVLGSWKYADGTEPSTDALPAVEDEESADSYYSEYVVKYTDQDGNPVVGVMCQVCDDATCQVFVSDENGECIFSLEPYEWEIHTLSIPEGYEGDTETVTIAPAEGGVLEFTLTAK